MKKNTWTIAEEMFLKKNYPKYGADYCSKKLNYSKGKIQNKTHNLRIMLLKDTKTVILSKSAEKCNVNPELFYNLDKKAVVYLLGLMWSDGFLNPSKNGSNYQLGFTMVKKDIEDIKHVLDSIGKWNYYERKQPVASWKPSINVITNNKRIFKFLIEHDYDKKSYISADKIILKIPDELKHYFFRGLIDGDGCFYYYKPVKGSILRQFSLTSTYEQDWSYVEDICNQLNVRYKINRVKNVKSSSSYIRITNKHGIYKLGEYVYQNFKEDKIGLLRKFSKYQQLICNHQHIY